ncbi:hypothetical protein [Archaeoglobus profundus]|uniref:Uncharacterized protein n=1 Tax=Archaeoglobus profundus (strain DSM 5631 / JCM 9629 / NBRC 100127 / Av18) TaxID=572546 RepID=D2REM1_ARCPA|nr:hypothetical protein [Archaeoglobus profundus]ADB58565.1 hypothetical protein Arcpr_1519 [Archaeoglobus profundus DSM 5631]
MKVIVPEVVVEALVNTFELPIEEVVEFVRKLVKDYGESIWELDIQLKEWDYRGNFKFVVRGPKHLEEDPKKLIRFVEMRFQMFLGELHRRLEEYNKLKPFLEFYSRNGWNSNREILEKVGIDVIS